MNTSTANTRGTTIKLRTSSRQLQEQRLGQDTAAKKHHLVHQLQRDDDDDGSSIKNAAQTDADIVVNTGANLTRTGRRIAEKRSYVTNDTKQSLAVMQQKVLFVWDEEQLLLQEHEQRHEQHVDDGDDDVGAEKAAKKRKCHSSITAERSNVSASSSAELDVGIQLLRDALDHLPPRETEACFTALQRNPALQTNEECLLEKAFLQKCHYDAWKAAKALALYWTVRKQVFGPIQYSKFMTCNYDGALVVDENHPKNQLIHDLNIIRIMKKPDSDGRPIIFLDRTLAAKHNFPYIAILRLLFYLIHVVHNHQQQHQEQQLQQQATTTTTGSTTTTTTTNRKKSTRHLEYVLVINLTNHMSRDFTFHFANILKNSPSICYATHACFHSPPASMAKSLLKPAVSFMQKLAHDVLQMKRFYLHQEADEESLLTSLSQYGIYSVHDCFFGKNEALIPSLRWDAIHWIQDRLAVETSINNSSDHNHQRRNDTDPITNFDNRKCSIDSDDEDDDDMTQKMKNTRRKE